MQILQMIKAIPFGKWACFASISTILMFQNPTNAQCTVNSTAGYSVSINVNPLAIVPLQDKCKNGYNYNVRFSYSITVTGTNNSYNGNIGVQPQIMCNNDNNGYYTISVPAPTVGAASKSTTYTGTLTTTTNPHRHVSDCETSTPTSLGCDTFLVTIYGPGIATATYPGNMVPLSVKFASINVKPEGNKALLKWSTASETDVASFTIERSTDGATWNSAGTINSEGNSTVLKSYSFTDAQAKVGKNYYRVKETDLNGSTTYSAVVKVNIEGQQDAAELITVAPNPSSGKISIIKNNEDDEAGAVTVYNIQGKQVYSSGKFQTEIDLSNQAEGIYFLHINLNSKTRIVKLAIER